MQMYRVLVLLLFAATPSLATPLTAQRGTPLAASPSLAAAPIHQEIDLAASPAGVYRALLDAKEFAAFSGLKATIDRAPGGGFSLFGGQIVGRTIEVVPDRRIIQAWRAADWPVGIYSIARFELVARGGGTHIVFDQTGYPADDRASLEAGWTNHYWTPLGKYLH